MKKFLPIFFLLMLANISIARADILKVSEIDVQKFVHSMADTIYSEEFQKESPLLISNATKIENTEFSEIGTTAWVCRYGLITADKPEGEIVFFVDDEEKVSALKVVGYSNDAVQDSVIMLMLSLRILGLTQADAEYLVSNLSGEDFLATSIVWSNELNRCMVLIAGGRDQAEGFQFLLMASDKKD